MAFVKLTSDMIDECFKDKTHQHDVIIALYKIVFPQWDDIEKIEGWPRVNKLTWGHICTKFFEFDKQHHPTVMAGGCWMNSGFGSDDTLPNWKISMDGVNVVLKSEVAAS